VTVTLEKAVRLASEKSSITISILKTAMKKTEQTEINLIRFLDLFKTNAASQIFSNFCVVFISLKYRGGNPKGMGRIYPPIIWLHLATANNLKV